MNKLILRPLKNYLSRLEYREEAELRVARRLIKDGTAIDVGTDWGMYTRFMMGKADRVIAPGYRPHYWDGSKLTSCSAEDVYRLQKLDRYVANFFFLQN